MFMYGLRMLLSLHLLLLLLSTTQQMRRDVAAVFKKIYAFARIARSAWTRVPANEPAER